MPSRRGLTLLESTHHQFASAMWSAVLGTAAQVALVLVLARTAASIKPADDGKLTPIQVHFLAPKKQQRPEPIVDQLHLVGLSGAPAPVVQRATPASAKGDVPRANTVTEPPSLSTPESAAQDPPKVLSEIEVDSLAERDPESEGPSYPPKMLAQRVEGIVMTTFVVDSTGRIDMESVKVVQSTNQAFTDAVRVAMPRMKFRPAWFSGHVVSQLVSQSFTFRIATPAPLAR